VNYPSLSVSYPHVASSAKTMLVTLGLLFGMASVAHCSSGCALFNGPTPTTPEEQLEHDYTTEIVGCAALAGAPGPYDRAEDLACRAKVDCKYKLGPCSPEGK
jgi:hypothetical protein